MIADCFKLSQEQLSRRLMIAIPLFRRGHCRQQHGLCRHLLEYFGWANQLLAAATLWGRFHLPAQQKPMLLAGGGSAAFLSLVVFQYLFSSSEMCGFSEEASPDCQRP